MEKKKTILIVDDEANIAELIRYQLQSQGYHVLLAVNGKEGLSKIKIIPPDLIILDVNMPEMNGIEFFKAIIDCEDKPAYPVLVLTTRAEMEKIFKDVQAAGFLPKPFLMENLIAEVERILGENNLSRESSEG